MERSVDERAALIGPASEDLEQQYITVTREDLGLGAERDPTTAALQRCRKFVVKPMQWLLCLLAWQPFPWLGGRSRALGWLHGAANVGHALFVVLMLLLNYAIELSVCYQLAREAGPPCRTVVRQLVPDAVHVTAFFYAAYHFRIRQSGFDQIEMLIQTVVVQSLPMQGRAVVGDRGAAAMIGTLRRYLALALAWIVLRLLSYLVQDLFVNQLLAGSALPGTFNPLQFAAGLLKLFSDGVYSSVLGVVGVTYCMYCRLLMLFVDGLRHRIIHRTLALPTVIQEMTQICRYTREMNRGLGVALSLVLFLLTMHTINTFFDVLDGRRSMWDRVSLGLDLACYVALAATCLLVAAQFTATCGSLKATASMVKHGYRDAGPRELQSFLLYTYNMRLCAKVFAVPVTVALVSQLAFVAACTLVVLGRVGVFSEA